MFFSFSGLPYMLGDLELRFGILFWTHDLKPTDEWSKEHNLRKRSPDMNIRLVDWFWGALFPRKADSIFHESWCLHPIPLQGYVPRPFISISLSPPQGDSIQVLPAVSFWKREHYRLSYRGRSDMNIRSLIIMYCTLYMYNPRLSLYTVRIFC